MGEDGFECGFTHMIPICKKSGGFCSGICEIGVEPAAGSVKQEWSRQRDLWKKRVDLAWSVRLMELELEWDLQKKG